MVGLCAERLVTPYTVRAVNGTHTMFVLIFELSTIACADLGRLGYSGRLTPLRRPPLCTSVSSSSKILR